jgi:hypothetical protein
MGEKAFSYSLLKNSHEMAQFSRSIGSDWPSFSAFRIFNRIGSDFDDKKYRMEISRLSGAGGYLAPSAPATTPPGLRADRLAVVKATQAIEASGMLGSDRELSFRIDQATRKLVVSVVDAQTKQILTQMPSEEVLRMAAAMNPSSPETTPGSTTA